ncbi:MAG TPA: preprotein translocase subunit SecG [Alphaproteobacteria bacterium]|jgi:preprotein translocase subunit SecG|nr:preprotein translocase subunit SecG [Micavibrio sp.]HQX26967.1 preprotein translocase subunit SecG [Alphaproteobacteria bacterium]
MEVILVIHLFLALAIIGLVLLQRSEGGGLGMGGGGLGGLASPRGATNALTRATAFCAAAFFCTSLILGILAGRSSTAGTSILDALDAPAPVTQEAPVNPEAGKSEEGSASKKSDAAPSAPIAE